MLFGANELAHTAEKYRLGQQGHTCFEMYIQHLTHNALVHTLDPHMLETYKGLGGFS